MSILLSIDVGGTNTRATVFSLNELPDKYHIIRYVNRNFGNFDEILKQIIKDLVIKPEETHICICAAGNVTNNSVRLTNYDWFLDGRVIQSNFEFSSCYILNDLEAAGYYFSKEAEIHSRICVVGIGTGLGTCFVINDKNPVIVPTETGHIKFRPHQTIDQTFFLKETFAEFEDYLSGRGIIELYHLIATQKNTNEITSEEIISLGLENNLSDFSVTLELFCLTLINYVAHLTKIFNIDKIIFTESILISLEDYFIQRYISFEGKSINNSIYKYPEISFNQDANCNILGNYWYKKFIDS